MEDKRYEEVLERAREIYANPREALKDNVNLTNEGSVAAIKVALLDLFPMEKLVDSEDERIRKELIFFFKEEISQCSIKEHANKLKEFVAWLEKKKEQEPAEWNKEDMVMFSKLLFILQTLVFPCEQERKEIISWLKSLYHKPNLKPIPSVRKII